MLPVAAVVVVALAGGAPAAVAQSRPNYPAVFGGASDKGSDARDVLSLSTTVTEAYDDNLRAEASAAPSVIQIGGVYTSLTPEVSLQAHGSRLDFGANGTSSFRHYPSFGQTLATNHNVGAGFSARVTRETTLMVNQSVNYAPQSLYGLFATSSTPVLGQLIAAEPDYQTSSAWSYTYGTTAAVSHTINSRASLSLNGDFRYTGYTANATGLSNLRSSDAGGRFMYAVKRGLGLRLGYTYRQARYAALFRTAEHDLEIGFDYSRPLSSTRRLTIGFSLGPSLVSTGATQVTGLSASGQSQLGGDRYRVRGDVSLDYQIGRSWSARAEYHRGLSYVAGLAGPVYTDSASVETTGFLNRRVDFLLSAAYATGQMPSQSAAVAPFTTYTGDARLRFAVSHQCAAYVEGLFYDYAFDPRLVIVPGMPDHFKRTGARTGITLWLSARSGNRAAR
jgi:hypothetical protein